LDRSLVGAATALKLSQLDFSDDVVVIPHGAAVIDGKFQFLSPHLVDQRDENLLGYFSPGGFQGSHGAEFQGIGFGLRPGPGPERRKQGNQKNRESKFQ
jgi:hypothetical protein